MAGSRKRHCKQQVFNNSRRTKYTSPLLSLALPDDEPEDPPDLDLCLGSPFLTLRLGFGHDSGELIGDPVWVAGAERRAVFEDGRDRGKVEGELRHGLGEGGGQPGKRAGDNKGRRPTSASEISLSIACSISSPAVPSTAGWTSQSQSPTAP